jgi:hypothetical protein
MQRKLLGIINEDFDTTGELLIIYCVFCIRQILVKKLENNCAAFSLEPLAQDQRNKIMDLRSVNHFTPVPLPLSVLHGAL